jgi:thiol-disulfide isomerase/thioredoxin
MPAGRHPLKPLHTGRQLPWLLAGILLLAAPSLFPAGSPATATVKIASLEVHESMSTGSAVAKVLKKGDKVVVGLELQIGGADWCEVSEPGKGARLGYVPCAALARPAPPTRSADRRFIPGEVEAPDFTLTGLDGQSYSLHDLRGHYVLLDFWVTWCGPCRMEMPRLDQLQKEYAGSGLEVVGVNAGEAPDRVRRFIEQNGYSYTILFDPQDTASRLYDAEYIPTLVVIDPRGDVRFYDSGAYPEQALRAVLARVGLR